MSPVQERRKVLKLHKHFFMNSALLALIDPVRGTPTKDSLEAYFPRDEFLQNYQVKQRFLDSFAFICSTSNSGKETASAVCMEQNPSSETILRVARNHGLSLPDLHGLERVLQILIATARGERLPKQAEDEVLNEVVRLDRNRILSLVEKLEKSEIHRVFQQAICRLSSSFRNEDILKDPSFRSWIKMCPFVARTRSSSATPQLTFLVEWAMLARWKYSTHLQVLLNFAQIPTPPWMETLYKLARYCGECKYMVKFAMKQPEVFASIRIQRIEAPAQRTFSLLNDKIPLQKLLERLVRNRSMITKTKDKLADRWQTSNVDAKLHGACNLRLTLHAEMQLLGFYECNPALVPQLRLMGTSKKACYLCHQYLLLHTFSIRVSACHQKIYPTWMPPPCHDVPGEPKYNCFWRLSKTIEQITKEELNSDLKAPRRPRNKDSTAGPSLTVTATVPAEVWERHIAR